MPSRKGAAATPQSCAEVQMQSPKLPAAVALIFTGFLFLSCSKPAAPGKVQDLEKVRMGLRNSPVCALVYVAQRQDQFKRHGVDLTVENYEAGAYAVNDLVAGKVDVVTAAETVLAVQGFKNPNLRTIATISSTNNTEVIARKDRGIANPGDLRRKRIGVVKGNVTEFFLYSFLAFHGVRPGEIETVDINPTEMVTAIAQGKIDAASCFPPFSNAIKKNLGREVDKNKITKDQMEKTLGRIKPALELKEAAKDAERSLEQNGYVKYLDETVIECLRMASIDRQRGVLGKEQLEDLRAVLLEYICHIRELLDFKHEQRAAEVGERENAPPIKTATADPSNTRFTRLTRRSSCAPVTSPTETRTTISVSESCAPLAAVLIPVNPPGDGHCVEIPSSERMASATSSAAA